jgi:hypothetical protein
MHENVHSTHGHRVRIGVLAALTVLVLLLASAQPARAASGNPTASDDQYGAVLGQQGGGQGGSLPFTGLDLIVVLAAGTGLTAAGIAARRIARST